MQVARQNQAVARELIHAEERGDMNAKRERGDGDQEDVNRRQKLGGLKGGQFGSMGAEHGRLCGRPRDKQKKKVRALLSLVAT